MMVTPLVRSSWTFGRNLLELISTHPSAALVIMKVMPRVFAYLRMTSAAESRFSRASAIIGGIFLE
jgi:hypothetical protein